MYEKRNIRLLVSLITLSAITVLLFIMSNRESNTEIDKTLFRVEDQAKVDHVVIQSPKGKVELKYESSVWKVNGYDADRQSIKIFFAVLAQAEAKRKVSESLQDSVRKEIEKNGTHLQLYEGTTLKKEFYIGTNEQKTETYFLLPGENTPYVIIIPGYRVLVASVFDQSANDMRDKLIFHFRWENFKSLTATFPADASQNFTISNKNKYFEVENLTATDTTKLNNYLDAVSLLQADKILTPEESKPYDSILALPPTLQITISDIASRTYGLTLYPHSKTSEWTIARKEDGESVLFQSRRVEEILRKKSYFLPK